VDCSKGRGEFGLFLFSEVPEVHQVNGVWCVAGIIPECALFTYMGSLAENMTQVLNGQGKPRGKLTWIITGAMALIVVITVTWATLFIR
jgi:hypothetical protein